MAPKTQTIEIDDATAEALRARSAEMGISVSELLAELAAAEAGTSDGAALYAVLTEGATPDAA